MSGITRGRQQQSQFRQPKQMIDNNNKREHLSIIIYIFYFDDDCVRVIILHCTMHMVVFSTRMIELVQISFRMERVFVVVYSIHSSSAIFGN